MQGVVWLLLWSATTLCGCAWSASTAPGAAPPALELATAHAKQRVVRAANASARQAWPSRADIREEREGMLDAADGGRWMEALRIADWFLAVEPDAWQGHVIRTRALYLGLLDDEAALESANACLELPEAPWECREVRALILYDQGRLRGAIEAFDELLEVQPAHQRAHELKARTLMQLDRDEESIQLLRFMISTWPTDTRIRILLATALERSGQVGAARRTWERVSEMHRDRREGLRYLKAFHERHDNRREADVVRRELERISRPPSRRQLDPL